MGLVLPFVFVWQLFRVRRHWLQCRWGGLLPAALCLASLPLAIAAGRLLFEVRFLLHRARYEAVAARVRDGTYSPPTDEVSLSRARYLAQLSHAQQGQRVRSCLEGTERLHPEDRSLGYWACPVWEDGKVVTVKFAVVSHGLGHVSGFIRVYEGENQGHYSWPIAPGWYRTSI